MTIARYLVLAAVASALPSAVMAQDAEVKFWLKGAPNNIQGCIAADPSFTREQTFLLANGQAQIKSSGGINVKLKLGRDGVYHGDFDLGRLNLNVVADIHSTPKTLTVTSRDQGCKWSAIKS
ncbi:MAG: hypothetical protein Q8N31_04570 [Reyranella sp.]|nr:hypothetical protein [Reyranella sp.]